MKKNIIYIIILVILIGFVVYFNLKDNSSKTAPIQEQTSFNPRNSSFKIENAPVTLVNGIAEVELASIPGAKITTRYFGNEIRHDLDNDGREDSIFLVTQDGGGSGTFFYVVAVLDTANGYVGSNSYFLGDRIAPQSIYIDEGETSMGTMRDNVIVVDYAVRNPNEPMTTPPSVGKSVWLKLDPVTMQFGEVSQNFEGESQTVSEESIVGTYIGHLAKDVYVLTISSQQSEFIKGKLDIKNFEKDSSTGSLKGTYKNKILLADYTFQSEGTESVNWVAFKKTADGFIRGFGNIDPETKAQSIDLSKINFDSSVIYKLSNTNSI